MVARLRRGRRGNLPPAVIHHRDHGVRWTDETTFAIEEIGRAPQAPEVLVLMHGGRLLHETVIRVEAAQDVRARLPEMLERPEVYGLSYWLQRDNLHFLAAAIPDLEHRGRTVARLAALSKVPLRGCRCCWPTTRSSRRSRRRR